MAWMKKTLAAFLAAALLLTGCGGQDTDWVYEWNNTTPPAGVYIFNMMVAFAEALDKDREANGDNADYEEPDYKNLLKKTVEGQDASAWINARAEDLTRQYFWVDQQFEQMGLELTEAEEESLDSNVAAMWRTSYSASDKFSTLGEYYEKNGVGQSSMLQYQRYLTKKVRLFELLYGPEGEFAVDDQELQEYFADNYTMVDFIDFYKYVYAEDAEQEASDAELKREVEGYMDRLKDGEDIEQIRYEYKIADLGTEAQGSVEKSEPGVNTLMVDRDDSMGLGEPLSSAFFEAKVGEPYLVEDEMNFYVIMRQDILENLFTFYTYRSDLLQEYKSEEYEDYVQEQAQSVLMTSNQAALERYQPSKIVQG